MSQRGQKARAGLLAFVLSFTVTPAAETATLAGRAMGTTWSVKFVQPSTPIAADEVQRRVAARLEELEQQFSTYRPTSELSRFNAGASRSDAWFPVSREVARVAQLSRELSMVTGGAFDVTVEPLVRLWGFGPTREAGVPGPEEIRAVRAAVDWRALEARAEPPALRRVRPGITADFSSVAKGFAADEVRALLTRLGAGNHLAQIGGDMKASGAGPAGRGWPVGIESPADEGRAIALVVGLDGHALSTSGDYRNYFIEGDRRYGHIIDPRTGEPVQGDLAAVSVIGPEAARTSGLATGLFVLGAKRGFELAERERWACVFFVRTRGGQIVQQETMEFKKLRR